MKFFLYVLIQETHPCAWIQLPCAYRWLLLAASLSPDLPTHQLQRLITKNVSIEAAHYHPTPQFLHLHLLPSHLKPKAGPASKTCTFSYASCLSKGRAPYYSSFLSLPSGFHTIQFRSQHTMLTSTVRSLSLQQTEGEEDSEEGSSQDVLISDRGKNGNHECFLVVGGGWALTPRIRAGHGLPNLAPRPRNPDVGWTPVLRFLLHPEGSGDNCSSPAGQL